MSSLFHKKTIAHYVSPEITVGFSQFGPTLTVTGVLSSARKVVFVNSIGLSVKTPFTALKKEFEWFALQTGSAPAAPAGTIFQAPSKFVLSPESPRSYNILFVDNQQYAEMKNTVSNISSAWEDLFKNSQGKDRRQLFDIFKKTAVPTETVHILKKLCYWKTGAYAVSITAATQDGIFTEEKQFHLLDDHITLLMGNSVAMISVLCAQPSAALSSVSVPLIEK